MTLFDLLFLAAVLAAVAALIVAAVAAFRGRRSRSLGILRRLAMAVAAYVAVVAIVGLLAPQRVLRVGDPWCFDDWCLSVEKVTQAPARSGTAYTVSLRLFSQARRVSQRALGAWIYVIDQKDRRYAPEPDPSAVPLDVLLGPGESVTTSRLFEVPGGAGPPGLITGHGGPVWLPNLIIGDEGSLFHKRTYVRLE